MIYVGLDDTDMPDTSGTNHLARRVVQEIAHELPCRVILRHQLFEHPEVPCTRKNGCASLRFEPPRSVSSSQVADLLRPLVLEWSIPGSDPGLCVTDLEQIPPEVTRWGRRAQRELLTQAEARRLAAEHGIHLEGLGGTEDGVIGALAAVGLMATRDDGRVVYLSSSHEDALDVTGDLPIDFILSRGVHRVLDHDTGEPLTNGRVTIGKKLRPNLRGGRVVLYARRLTGDVYEAVRVT